MDVCMLCYKVDDYTKFIYPLKLHESLASGLPCVGAPDSALSRSSASVLDLAGTVEEWSEALAAALSPTARSEARSAARREVARHHDWDRLVHQIATAIGDRLGPSYRQRVQQGMPASPRRIVLARAAMIRVKAAEPRWRRWRHRADLVSHLARREFSLRYHDSALGVLWSLLLPLGPAARPRLPVPARYPARYRRLPGVRPQRPAAVAMV